MPRRSTVHQQTLPDISLVVDNGAFSIKAGFVSSPNPGNALTSSSLDDCQIIPNCLARERDRKVWVGSEIEAVQDFGEMAFRRPVEKGYLVNWEAEKAIWDSTFLDPKSRLSVKAPNTTAALQSNCDQVIFEEYEFATYSRHIGPSLNAYHDIQHFFGASSRDTRTPAAPHGQSSGSPFQETRKPVNTQLPATPAECLLVIDSGYSHTTVTPLYKGRPIQQAIRRLDVGGKLLTNYLKELLSVRHYNLMNEEHLVNEAKEKVCFVSNHFRNDLERAWKGASKRGLPEDQQEIVVDYVLPDYNTGTTGHMRPHDPSLAARVKKIGAMANPGGVVEDFMTLGNERFTVPELLFNPADVGMKEAGLPETVMQSLSGLPQGLWPAMLANVVVVGGNSLFEGFMMRLRTTTTPSPSPADAMDIDSVHYGEQESTAIADRYDFDEEDIEQLLTEERGQSHLAIVLLLSH
ncbi:MAG: hypothetical protein Q9218_004131 [Villophora microphyllina]